jgi:flagellar basal-body rod protein FlgB
MINPLSGLDIARLASLRARHASERHSLIAQNIANADTPGFKAQDLEPFAEAAPRVMREGGVKRGLDTNVKRGLDANVKRGLDAGVKRGLDAGVKAAADAKFRTMEASAPGSESPNGNTVALEDQMARAASASRDHETAMLIYSKAVSMMRTALGRPA